MLPSNAWLTTPAAHTGIRVRGGLNTIKARIKRDGKFTSKAGKLRTRLGRPGAEPQKMAVDRRELTAGTGIGKAARLAGLGTGTVAKLKRKMAANCLGRAGAAADRSAINARSRGRMLSALHIAANTLTRPGPWSLPGILRCLV